MNRKRPALGRGLGAILPKSSNDDPRNSDTNIAPVGKPRLLPIEKLERNPAQPRKHFDPDALQELADSIKRYGILQPIVVSPGERGHFHIVAGERRWRASQLAGLHEVPIVIRETDENERLEVALVENLQRAELNPIEEALAYQDLIETHAYTQDAVAARVGKDRSSISNALRLLGLPEKVREWVVQGELSMGQARALLGLKEAAAMTELAAEVIAKKLSVRATERAVRQRLAPPPEPEAEPDRRKLVVDDLEMRLRRSLGVKARLRTGPKSDGPGRIELPYSNLDELHRLLQALINEPES